MPKKKKAKKLSKAARREIALRNLRKARRARFKVKRTGKKRFGRNKGEKIKVLTVSEAARRGRRRRKRRVSTKQREAARRNIRKAIAANRRKGRSHTKAPRRRHRRSRRRKNPILNPLPNPRKGKGRKKGGARKSARRMSKSRKRSLAAKKAWRTRKARAAARRGHSKKKRGASKRKHHRKSPKRVAAARKAAATRRERKYAHRMSTHAYGDEVAIFEERRRRGKRRHHRRHHARRRHYRRNPLPLVGVLANPIGRPMAFLGKAVSLGFGYLWEDAVIRYASTHALTGTGTVLTDQPAAGQIYNSEAPLLPLWSDYTKLAISVAGVAAPLVAGRFVARDFMNHAFIAAAVRFFGKLAVDATALYVPQVLPSADATTLRLYGAEAAAQARLAQVNVTPAASAPAATFAGLPKGARAALPPGPSRGMGDCSDSTPSMPVMSDPLAGQRNMLLGNTMPLPNNCQPPINLNNGFAPDAGGPATTPDQSLPMMSPSVPMGPPPVVMTPQPSGQTSITPQPAPPGVAPGPSRTIVPGTYVPGLPEAGGNPAPPPPATNTYVPR